VGLEQMLLKQPTDSPPQASWPGRHSCPLQWAVIPHHKPALNSTGDTTQQEQHENLAFLLQITCLQLRASVPNNNTS